MKTGYILAWVRYDEYNQRDDYMDCEVVYLRKETAQEEADKLNAQRLKIAISNWSIEDEITVTRQRELDILADAGLRPSGRVLHRDPKPTLESMKDRAGWHYVEPIEVVE